MIRQSKVGVFTRFLLTVMLSVWIVMVNVCHAANISYNGQDNVSVSDETDIDKINISDFQNTTISNVTSQHNFPVPVDNYNYGYISSQRNGAVLNIEDSTLVLQGLSVCPPYSSTLITNIDGTSRLNINNSKVEITNNYSHLYVDGVFTMDNSTLYNYGGSYVDSAVLRNSKIMYGGLRVRNGITMEDSTVVGGLYIYEKEHQADTEDMVQNNTATIRRSTFDYLSMARNAWSGNEDYVAKNNTLNLIDCKFFKLSVGQYEVRDNTVHITGGEITSANPSGTYESNRDLFVFGSKGGGSHTYVVSGNTLTIDGDCKISNPNIYLTYAPVRSENNTLNLFSGNGLTTNTVIDANLASSYYTVNTGNTLNVKNILGATINRIQDFQNINVYVPSTVQSGDTVFNIGSGYLNLSGVNVRAGFDGDVEFNAGDYVNIFKSNYITTDENTTFGTLTSGVSTIYDGLVLKKQQNNDNTQAIILTIPASDPPAPPVDPDPPVPPVDPDPPLILPPAVNPAPVVRRVNPEIMSLNAGQAASLELIQQGRELATQVRHAETTDNGIFGVIGASKVNRDDASMQFNHVIAGWKKSDKDQTAAAYAWYGRGNYDADIAGIDADGSASAVGVGGLYRKNLQDDLFIEGQLGFGQVMRDYKGKGFSTVIDNTSYDGHSMFVSGAVTFGKTWRLSEDKIEAYMTVAHDRVGGFDAKLSSGEKFDFGDAAQTTVGVGCTYEKDLGKSGKLYAGIEVNQGIGGKVDATYKHGNAGEIDLDGITAELNLGWKQEMKDGSSVSINLHGLTGARQGGAIDILYSKAL